jgi:hypothetical protein
MTALALALVACCAMLCGTRLVLRGYDIREVEAEAAMRDSSGVRLDLASLAGRVEGLGSELDAARKEVASLRADLATRSL